MNKELFSLMFQLDKEFDVDISEYFKLSEEQKMQITNYIIQYYMPLFKSSEAALINIILNYQIKLENAIEDEDFETADICDRLLKTLREINSINDIDWEQA